MNRLHHCYSYHHGRHRQPFTDVPALFQCITIVNSIWIAAKLDRTVNFIRMTARFHEFAARFIQPNLVDLFLYHIFRIFVFAVCCATHDSLPVENYITITYRKLVQSRRVNLFATADGIFRRNCVNGRKRVKIEFNTKEIHIGWKFYLFAFFN